MNIVDDPELTKEIMARIKKKYAAHTRKIKTDGIHLTMLIYCITRTYWQEITELKPTDEDARHWAGGLGLEEVLLRDEINDTNIKPAILDGITVSPDYQMVLNGRMAELKTTNMWPNKDGSGLPSVGLPDTWEQQMMGYTLGYPEITKSGYSLSIFYISKAKSIVSKRITFDYETELKPFWEGILTRKAVLETALKEHKPPEPFAFNQEWECKRCPALVLCQLAQANGDFIKKEDSNE